MPHHALQQDGAAPPPTPCAFVIHAEDTVATLLADASPGPVRLLGAATGVLLASEPTSLGHKLALVDIPAGAGVIKYGVRIGHATVAIPRGAWVHLHNLASDHDEHSSRLDVLTGAPKDTSYV